MKLTEKEVYVFGFRETTNNEWLTSGIEYGNEIDARNALVDMRRHLPDLEYEIFKFGRSHPIFFKENLWLLNTTIKTNSIA